MDFKATLSSLVGPQTASLLEHVGVDSMADLAELCEADLVFLGLNLVHIRRLQRLIQENMEPQAQDQAPLAPSLPNQAEFALLGAMTATAIAKAAGNLALAIKETESQEIIDIIKPALHLIMVGPPSAQTIMRALNATIRAMSHLGNCNTKKILHSAAHELRDGMNGWIQLTTPLGNRDMFILALKQVWGARRHGPCGPRSRASHGPAMEQTAAEQEAAEQEAPAEEVQAVQAVQAAPAVEPAGERSRGAKKNAVEQAAFEQAAAEQEAAEQEAVQAVEDAGERSRDAKKTVLEQAAAEQEAAEQEAAEQEAPAEEAAAEEAAGEEYYIIEPPPGLEVI